MLPRGDDKDEDDFHLFTRRFTACRYRYPTIIYDVEVLLIRGLLNHFMNMKVGTPTTLPHSSTLTSTSIDSYCGEFVSSTIIMTSVVVVVDIVKINQASGVVFLLCSTS